MDPSMIGVWMPIFIVLFLIIPQQQAVKKAVLVIKKIRRRGGHMTNELIQKFRGRYCYISTGSLGTSVEGKIVEIKDNWIEVETKKGKQALNLDFIQIIRIKE